MTTKVKYTDGMDIQAKDIGGTVRQGKLEILSTQVFVQFLDGSGVFLKHDDFFQEQKQLRAKAH